MVSQTLKNINQYKFLNKITINRITKKLNYQSVEQAGSEEIIERTPVNTTLHCVNLEINLACGNYQKAFDTEENRSMMTH